MPRQIGERMEGVRVAMEIFTATGVLAEAFALTGPTVYPNGVLDVAYKNDKNVWVDFKPSKYSIISSTSVAFVAGFKVPVDTLVRVAYISPGA